MKIHCLGSNGRAEASMRFRVLQFFPVLEQAGHVPTVSSFFDEAGVGGFGRRLVRGLRRRAADAVTVRNVDRVIIHREILPLAWNDAVRLLPKQVPVIFDFDDAVYLSTAAGLRGLVSRPRSTRLLIDRADLIYAGSDELADYASRANANVRLIPTVVDTELFRPREPSPERERLRLGWIGSPSTARYLPKILPVLERLARSFDFEVQIVGTRPLPVGPGLRITFDPWRLEDEVRRFQELDIGIYPLLDVPWSRGKCGFKAVQYMACGVPLVATPVGVLKNIVREGIDGLWATSEQQWADALGQLLTDAALRSRLRESGRERAHAQYSLAAIAPKWIAGIEMARRGGI